jgi:hypothetical protein
MATIYVRKLYVDQGKFGMEYKIYATNGIYYQSRKPFPEFVEEGAALEVEAEATKNPKYMKLKSVEKSNAHPTSGKGPVPAGPVSPAPLPTLTPEMQAEFMRKAHDAMNLFYGRDWDPMVYAPVLAELVHQHYGDYVAEQQRARWGK